MKSLKKNLYKHIDSALSLIGLPKKDYSLIPPKSSSFGDISSNIGLLIGSELKINPMICAQQILDELNRNNIENIKSITVTKPGFINFFIEDSFFQNYIRNINSLKSKFGRSSIGKGKKVNVEFVSANPTGPLTVGHGRNAVIGDTVSNILKWNGFNVTREYYFNNAGRQMRILGESVKARYLELSENNNEFPEDGYHGNYIKDIAKEIFDKSPEDFIQTIEYFKDYAEKNIFIEIKKSLKKLGIKFDAFTNEKMFYENGDIELLISELKKKKLIYEKDGAKWFRATDLGKEKDKVYIKSTGEPTYRVPDTAYHRNKLDRKYDLIIDVFGADHADSYPDVLLALEALGYDIKPIKILIYQFVTLVKNGEKIKMSTRKANFVTLDKLLAELGPDVVRYFFIMRSMNSHLDFDLNLASDQSDSNPVFYLQYAYARICNIIKHGENNSLSLNEKYNQSILCHNDELKLLKHIVLFPDLVETASKTLEPQNIATYLQDLAALFHRFYSKCRVISDDSELSKARLNLINAVKITLENGLKVLGISAPEKM
tara:strand:- start:2856 stop:4490 length:1635 start_codon:yes stop_codon:yes gene_type:complete